MMRAKHYEKVLNKRRKQQQVEIEKIEQLELDNSYFGKDGTIDWNKLAKHVNEATSGRQQS